ncbi:nuclear hormone receptor HR96-like [Oppia nitens]|uniref:nuclear hormone receptor HR96-like n=1 Tax=Oppia nitens TaxID=1686743 RepID=UPI0023DCDAFE|nr:nuclear hormone receptor HR96-like [Oppia nitens]
MTTNLKKCMVCGDNAFGYNFCAVTCESCKAFFRRNAFRLDDLPDCPFDGQCTVDVDTRKYCKRCRLNKCFNVGMKKEWIIQKKKPKKKKLGHKVNRKTSKSTVNYKYSSADPLDAKYVPEVESCDTNENSLNLDILDNLNSGDSLNDKSESEKLSFDSNGFNGFNGFNDNLLNNVNTISLVNNNNNISAKTYRKLLELELSVLSIPKEINNNNYFTEVENCRLIELFQETVATSYENTNNKLIISQFNEIPNCFIMKFEAYIHKFIHLAKRLTPFRELCDNDQLALVKYGCIEALFMLIAPLFDYNTKCFTFQMINGNTFVMDLEVMKSNHPIVYTLYNRFLTNFYNEWDSDPFIVDLLVAIILFNPERPNLIYNELVKLQYHLYIHLLIRYLRLKYGYNYDAKTKFMKIFNIIQDVEQLDQINRQNHGAYGQKTDLNPLVQEIFDISSHNKPVNMCNKTINF